MQLDRLAGILVPIDHSDLSWRALEAALSIAPQDKVHIVHILPVAGGLSWAVGGAVGDAPRVEGARMRIAREIAERGIAAGDCPIHVRAGAPGPEICELAGQLGAELVIIGSHGRGGLEKLILGSVAYDVVRNAPCSVMLIRPERRDASGRTG